MPFHGIVRRAGQWFRLLTDAPLLEGDQVLEEFRSGPYTPAFLNQFFSGKYRVEVRKHKSRRKYAGSKHAPSVTSEELFSSEVIRWSTASEQHIVRVKGNKGWLSCFNEIGLIIQNSKKQSKRLAEIVRTTCAWLYVEDGSLSVEVIEHSFPEERVDGISAMSRSLAYSCIMSNTNATRRWRARELWKVRTGQTANVIFRMLTPNGLIKGNAFILPRKMMNGYDVRTFTPNIKSEIRTSGWQWVTIEPTYGVIPIKSDDLTHAIYREVNGLYDDATLLASLSGMLKSFFSDLMKGKRSEWLTRLVDAEQVVHEEDEERFSADRGLVGILQDRIAELHKLGVSLTASQTLMFLSVNGLRKQLLTDKTVDDGNGNHRKLRSWEDKTRHWFPVPWAYSAHVMTQEALQLFGFPVTSGKSGYYHKATHSFVVPGEFFEKHYADHGGWDLDDSVKVHIRFVKFPNGDIKLMAILLRNPNDFGEWSMIPVEEAGPVFHQYTEQPPVVDYGQLTTLVPQFSTVKDKLDIGSLPGSLTFGEEFSLEDELRVRTTALMFPAGTGGAVLPKMLHAALVGGYLPKLYAPNEQIIDALQQGSATPEDVTVINQYVTYIFSQLAKETGGEIDAFWYNTRLFDALADNHGLYCGKLEDSPWISLHTQREEMVQSALKAMTNWLNTTIVKPELLDEIEWTTDEYLSAPNELNKIKAAKNRSLNWVAEFVQLLEESDAEHGEERTNRKILRLANQAFAAKDQYPSANHDQWLYSFSAKSDKQPVDWFIRALKAQANR